MARVEFGRSKLGKKLREVETPLEKRQREAIEKLGGPEKLGFVPIKVPIRRGGGGGVGGGFSRDDSARIQAERRRAEELARQKKIQEARRKEAERKSAREKRIKIAQERFRKETIRRLTRERQRKKISLKIPFGATQPERDILKQQRFFERREARKTKTTITEIPQKKLAGRPKIEIKEKPKSKHEERVEELGAKREKLRGEVFREKGKPPRTTKELVKEIATGKRPSIFGINTLISKPAVTQKESLKNIYTIEQRLLETFLGVKQIPSIANQIRKNPKSIIPLTGALARGVKLDALNTLKIAKTSPSEAVLIVGTDVFIGTSIGKGFKITGKVGGAVGKNILKNADETRIFKKINKNPKKNLDFSVLGEIDEKINIKNFKPRVEKANKTIKKLNLSIETLDNIQKKINVLGQKIPRPGTIEKLQPPLIRTIKKRIRALNKTKIERARLRVQIRKFNLLLDKDLGALSRIKNIIAIDKLRRRVAKIKRSRFGKNIQKDVLKRIDEIIDIQKKSKKRIKTFVIKGKKVPSVRKIAKKEAKRMGRIEELRKRRLTGLTEQQRKLRKEKIDFDVQQRKLDEAIRKAGIDIKKFRFVKTDQSALKKLKTKKRLREAAKTRLTRLTKEQRAFLKQEKKLDIAIRKARIEKKRFKLKKPSQLALKKFKTKKRLREAVRAKLTGLNKQQRKLRKEKIDFDVQQRKLDEAIRKAGIDIKKFRFVKTDQSALKKLKAKKRLRESAKTRLTGLTKDQRAFLKQERKLDIALEKAKIRTKKGKFITSKLALKKFKAKPKLKIKFIKPSKLALERLKRAKIKRVPKRKPKIPSKPKPVTFIVEPPKIPKSEIPKGFKAVRTKSGQILLQKTKIIQKKAIKTKRQPIVFIEASQLALKRFKQKQGLLEKQIQKTKQKARLTTSQKQSLAQKQKSLKTLKTKTVLLERQIDKLRIFQRFAQGQLSKFRQSQKGRGKQIPGEGQAQKIKQKLKTRLDFTRVKLKLKPKVALKQPEKQKLKKKLRTKTKQITRRVKKKISVSIVRKTKRFPKPKKPVQVFNVFGKSKGKFVRLNVKPLKKNDALSRGAFAVDRTTARTFKIIPAGKSKKHGNLLKKERGYFSKVKRKLRSFKIKKGKKFKLENKYIEKRKFGIDTRSEKKGLGIRRLIEQRKKPKRIITPSQRKVLLKRLEKARRVRSSNRKKGGRK